MAISSWNSNQVKLWIPTWVRIIIYTDLAPQVDPLVVFFAISICLHEAVIIIRRSVHFQLILKILLCDISTS